MCPGRVRSPITLQLISAAKLGWDSLRLCPDSAASANQAEAISLPFLWHFKLLAEYEHERRQGKCRFSFQPQFIDLLDTRKTAADTG